MARSPKDCNKRLQWVVGSFRPRYDHHSMTVMGRLPLAAIRGRGKAARRSDRIALFELGPAWFFALVSGERNGTPVFAGV